MLNVLPVTTETPIFDTIWYYPGGSDHLVSIEASWSGTRRPATYATFNIRMYDPTCESGWAYYSGDDATTAPGPVFHAINEDAVTFMPSNLLSPDLGKHCHDGLTWPAELIVDSADYKSDGLDLSNLNNKTIKYKKIDSDDATFIAWAQYW